MIQPTARRKPTVSPKRRALLGLVHKGAAKMFGDDREAYEDWLERETGARSCKALTVDQLDGLVTGLRRDNLLPPRSVKGGTGKTNNGEDRPTDAQIRKLGALSRARGWEGLDDARLLAFVKRTAKVEAVGWMTRRQASAVITGLTKWKPA